MSRITVSDGSSWPRPYVENEEDVGIEWKLRYAPRLLNRSDFLEIAAIMSAYDHLILGSTQAKRDLVCRDIRAALKEES